MKLLFLFLVMFSSIFFWSCNESSVSVFEVALDEYKAERKDSIIVNVEKAGAIIELKGTVDIIEGECHLWMRNPDNDTIYAQVFADPGLTKVSQDFLRTQGEWVFVYQLKRIENTQPSGSLNLQIRYKD
jgi:hypothetical protein